MPDASTSKFISSQNESQRQVDKDGVFLTENFGGLNVESSPVNMPISDSPEMMNIEISTSGILKKRKGSQLVVSDLEKAHCLIPFKLLNGQQMMVVIDGNDLLVYKVPSTVGGSWTLIESMTPFANLLSDKTDYTQFSWTITKELIPRIIICSPNNVPIQLTILQYEVDYTSPNTYVTIPYNYGRHYSHASNAFYFDADGNNYATTSITQTSPTTTQFNLTTQPAASTTGVICSFAFHWWAEAMLLRQDQLYDSYFRFNTNKTSDCVVEIPSNLLYSITNDYAFWTGDGSYDLPLFPARDNGTTRSWFVPDNDPQTNATNVALAFHWSDGQYITGGTYDVTTSTNNASSDTSNITLGFTHLTFGGVNVSSGSYTEPPTPIHFVRAYYLPFNGGQGVAGNNLYVFNGKAQHTFLAGTGSGLVAYSTQPNYLLRTAAAAEVTNAASATGKFISFDGNYPIGIPTDSVDIIHTTVSSSYVGTDYVTSLWAAGTDGGCMEAWGISRYANYYAGEFPTLVGQYQSRLVLSGFTADKSVVLFSNVGTNSGWVNEDVVGRNWQILLEDPTIDTKPLEIKLPISQDEEITGLQQWYDDLFVTTNRNVYRIHGGSSVAISPTNFFVSKIGNVGALRECITLTSEGVVFLSKAGVYQIKLDNDSGAYYVENIGLKIRRHLLGGMTDGRGDKGLGYLVYDSEDNVLYCGIGDYENSDIPRRMFVFFFDRQAWSEYSLYNGWFPSRHGASMDGRLWFTFKHSDGSYATASPDGLGQDSVYSSEIAEFKIHNSDFVKSISIEYYDPTAGSDNDYTKAGYIRMPRCTLAHNRSSFTPTGDVYIDMRSTPDSGQSFRMLPFIDDDSNLDIGTTTVTDMVLNTHYYRRNPQDLIILDGNFESGNTDIRLIDDEGVHSGVMVWDATNTQFVTNYELDAGDGFQTASDYGTDTVLVYASESGGDYDGGQQTLFMSYNIPCWWFSPVFTRNDIASYKRMMYWYGMFNSAGYNFYKFGNLFQATSAAADPRYVNWDKFNIALIAHGIRGGQKYVDIQGADSIKDTDPDAPQWNDYYRVANYLRGNYTDFQFVIYSFNPNTFEMIGYQIDTKGKGRTSRRAYYE